MEPQRSVIVRHTVGLTDPLSDEEIPAEERLDDGLPQSLAASIRFYGLTHFKILLSGDAAADLRRLRQVADLLEEHVAGDYAFTLDGSEHYTEMEPFRRDWNAILAEPSLHDFLRHLLFVEQPLRRDVALSPQAKSELLAWSDRPPLIIDESDGALSSVVEALDSGYVGASFKNCKGVFGGIANACLLAHRRRSDPGGYYVQSSEDLCQCRAGGNVARPGGAGKSRDRAFPAQRPPLLRRFEHVPRRRARGRACQARDALPPP